jgi:hypothetical protein
MLKTPSGGGTFAFEAASQYEFREDTTLEAVLFWLGIPANLTSLEWQVYLDHRAKRLYEGDGIEVSVIASHGIHKHWLVVATGSTPTDIHDMEGYTGYGERMFYRLPRPLLFRKGEDIFVHSDGWDPAGNTSLEYRVILYCSTRG